MSLGGLAAQALFFGSGVPAATVGRAEAGLEVSQVIYFPIGLKKHAGQFFQRKTPTITPFSTSSSTPTSEILTPTPSPTHSGINVPEPGIEVYSNCSVREERHDSNTDEVTGILNTIYNSLGRPVRVEQDIAGSHPDGNIDYITTYAYKNLWQPTERVQYQVGQELTILGKTRFVYNSIDQLIQEIRERSTGPVVSKSYEYDLDGKVIRVAGGGDIETRQYNEDKKLARRTFDYASDGRADFITLLEWSDGLITKTIDDVDADGKSDSEWSNTYDAQRRLVISESPVGNSYYFYNERGWMYSYRLEQGAGDRIVAIYRYDDMGRRVRLDLEDTGNGPSFREYKNFCP